MRFAKEKKTEENKMTRTVGDKTDETTVAIMRKRVVV